jgi:hypothetical protein
MAAHSSNKVRERVLLMRHNGDTWSVMLNVSAGSAAQGNIGRNTGKQGNYQRNIRGET